MSRPDACGHMPCPLRYPVCSSVFTLQPSHIDRALLTTLSSQPSSVQRIIMGNIGQQYDFIAEEAKANPKPGTVDSFPKLIESRSQYPEPHFVFLTSDIDEEKRVPWCPDVVRSLPAARRQVAKAGGTLFQINVGKRPVWKDPNHPFRQADSLEATGVPTIIHYTKDGPGKRLGKDLEQLGRGDPNGEQIVENRLAEFIASVK